MSNARFLKTCVALLAVMTYGACAAWRVPYGWILGVPLGWAFYTFVKGEARWTL